MTAIAAKKSVLALVVESTEGVLKAPTAATQYIAMRPGFTIEPGIETLENQEVKPSIGQSKPITGDENPSCSPGHYLRASGTQGAAPGFGPMLKALLGGESLQATERSTDSGSTVSVINLPAGQGAEIAKGETLLFKDPTNGYRARPAHSIATDAVTLGFNLPTGAAPASGVALGKSALYSPTNEDHQTLSVWHYMGNGGGIQAMAGGRVTEFSCEFAAGELIDASYKIDGLSFYLNPIEITAATRYIDWTDDDGTFAAAVATGWYKDPHELAEALQTVMRAGNAGETATVTYSDTTGKFTVKSTGSLLTLKFATGANTANTIATKIGFTVADESAVAATTGYTSDTAMSYASSYTPSYDTNQNPLVAKHNEFLLGEATDTTAVKASKVSWTITNVVEKLPDVTAQAGHSGSVVVGRMAKMTATVILDKFEAKTFKRYRAGDEVRAFYAAGTKTGGNWNAGYLVSLYMASATVSSFKVTEQGSLYYAEIELSAFVPSDSTGEVFACFN